MISCIELSSNVRVGYSGESQPQIDRKIRISVPEENIALGLDNLNLNFVDTQLKLDNTNVTTLFENDDKTLDTDILRVIFDSVSDFISDKIIINEPTISRQDYREALLNIFFEEMNVEEMLVQPNSILAAYATARTSGLVAEFDDYETACVYINEGNVNSFTYSSYKSGGFDLLDKISQDYNLKLPYQNSNSDLQFLTGSYVKFGHRDYMFDYLYQSYSNDPDNIETDENVDSETQESLFIEQELPDGLHLRKQYFNKHYIDSGILPGCIEKTISKTKKNFRDVNTSSLILSGDYFIVRPPDFDDELAKKISSSWFNGLPYISKSSWNINNKNNQNMMHKGWRILSRSLSTWKGTSILGVLDVISKFAITRKMYEEFGQNVWADYH